MSLPTLEANTISEIILPEAHKDEKASVLVTPVAPQSYEHEPVVTRREMWSYYCVYHSLYVFTFFCSSLTTFPQYIPLGTMYV
jgi:hypothetical protein